MSRFWSTACPSSSSFVAIFHHHHPVLPLNDIDAPSLNVLTLALAPQSRIFRYMAWVEPYYVSKNTLIVISALRFCRSWIVEAELDSMRTQLMTHAVQRYDGRHSFISTLLSLCVNVWLFVKARLAILAWFKFVLSDWYWRGFDSKKYLIMLLSQLPHFRLTSFRDSVIDEGWSKPITYYQ